MAKKTGTSTGGIETSAAYRRKRARRRREEERDWASRNGPVIVRIGESEIYVRSEKVKADLAKARRLLLGEIEGEGTGSVRPAS